MENCTICPLRNKYYDVLKSATAKCNRCNRSLARKNIVFGEGNINTDIMFILDSPTADNDLYGKHFIGKQGELLANIIEKGMVLPKTEAYVTSLVKCYADRPLLKEEISSCFWMLEEQIELVKPRVIISFGYTVTQELTKSDLNIFQTRGTVLYFENQTVKIPVIPTYALGYVLAEESKVPYLKKDVWEDIKAALRLLNEIKGGK